MIKRLLVGTVAVIAVAGGSLAAGTGTANAVWQPWCKHFDYHWICR